MVVVCKALDFFKRDEDIDEFETKKIATVMDDGEEGQVYENDEVALLDRVQEALLKTSALKFQNVVKDKEERDGIVWSKTNDRKMKNAVLRAVFVVDGTVEMCAAWEWNKGSRKRKKKACKICLHREVVELDEHTQLFRVITDPKTSGFRPREWVVKGVWRSERGGGGYWWRMRTWTSQRGGLWIKPLLGSSANTCGNLTGWRDWRTGCRRRGLAILSRWT